MPGMSFQPEPQDKMGWNGPLACSAFLLCKPVKRTATVTTSADISERRETKR